MKLKELTCCLSVHFHLVIEDRQSELGTVYIGELLHLRTTWDDREVAWIRPGPRKGLIIELL